MLQRVASAYLRVDILEGFVFGRKLSSRNPFAQSRGIQVRITYLSTSWRAMPKDGAGLISERATRVLYAVARSHTLHFPRNHNSDIARGNNLLLHAWFTVVRTLSCAHSQRPSRKWWPTACSHHHHEHIRC